MPAVKKYTRINFQNYPSTSTPLNATNLNKMDKGIDDLDDELVTVKNTIENMSFDADAISYDNTQSGLQATDVQGAVDEINDNLTASNQTAGVTNVPFRFGCTDDGEFGYIINQGGADAVIPFSYKMPYMKLLKSANKADNSPSRNVSLNHTITEKGLYLLIVESSRTNSFSNMSISINGTSQTLLDMSNTDIGLKQGIVLANLDINDTISMASIAQSGSYCRGACSIWKIENVKANSIELVYQLGKQDQSTQGNYTIQSNGYYLLMGKEFHGIAFGEEPKIYEDGIRLSYPELLDSRGWTETNPDSSLGLIIVSTSVRKLKSNQVVTSNVVCGTRNYSFSLTQIFKLTQSS